jgi:ribosomal protein S18 acetylase RimI-like enzyme
MTVKEFEATDKADFTELCQQFYDSMATLREYDQAVTDATFLRVLDHHENLWGYLFIDKESARPVGYALVTSYWSNEEGGNVIVLDEIYINPADRAKGYAQIFMDWLERHFSDCVTITLEVLANNKRAAAFYEKVGFVSDGYVSYTKKIKKREYGVI